MRDFIVRNVECFKFTIEAFYSKLGEELAESCYIF